MEQAKNPNHFTIPVTAWGVVLNVETGKQTQVGRQCLADFTGINWKPKSACSEGELATAHQVSEHFWGTPTMRSKCLRLIYAQILKPSRKPMPTPNTK